jgi:hypothetical protein
MSQLPPANILRPSDDYGEVGHLEEPHTSGVPSPEPQRAAAEEGQPREAALLRHHEAAQEEALPEREGVVVMRLLCMFTVSVRN